MLLSIDHIQLAMPPGCEASARQFYADILGLRELVKPEPLASRGGCWFEAPGVIVHLGVEGDFSPARKAHPAFLVDNLAALEALLLAANIKITLDDALPEIRRFYAPDPFGNRLEFIQSGDGFSERANPSPA